MVDKKAAVVQIQIDDLIDCDHDYYFIRSSRAVGENASSFEVNICRVCGKFFVTTRKNGQVVQLTFRLSSKESVEAAGKWYELLSQIDAGD